MNWFFVQFLNPLTNYNVNFVYKNNNFFVVRLDNYNLLKEISVHPIFFKWTEPIFIEVGFNINLDTFRNMLKIY